MQSLKQRMETVGELTHIDRFKLLMQMLRNGADDGDIHDVFRHAHNYERAKTQYFIDHARKTYDLSKQAAEEYKPSDGPWQPNWASTYVTLHLSRELAESPYLRGPGGGLRHHLHTWLLDGGESLPLGGPVDNPSHHTNIEVPGFLLEIVDDLRGKESRECWLRRFLHHITEGNLDTP